jgi:hypothetical protein
VPPRKGRIRRARLRTLLRSAIVLFLVVGSVAGIALFRLYRGPVSLGAAKGWLEAAISSELGSAAFQAKDAQLSLGRSGIELTFLDLRVSEADGSPLIQAPRAVVALSGAAALRGRLGVTRVALINPRLQAFYADDGTLSVRFALPQDSPAATTTETPAAASASTSTPADTSGPIDFVKAVTSVSAQARRREHATAFLREVALRQATLVVDNGRRKTIWQVPELKVNLNHKANRSEISGQVIVNSLTGPWSFDFNTNELAASQQLTIQAKVAGVNPRGLSRQVPAMATFEQLDLPLDGEAQLTLNAKGGLETATFALSARPGRFVSGPNARPVASIDAGTLRGSYDPALAKITISEAALSVDNNRLDLAGDLTRSTTVSAEGLPDWVFQFASKSGHLAAASPGATAVPIDSFRMRGHAVPEAGRLFFDDIALEAGGAAVTARGAISDLTTDAGRTTGLDARLAPMPMARLIALWPSSVMPEARSWLATHVTRGQLNGGAARYASAGDNRLSMSLEIGATTIVPFDGGAPIDVPKGSVRIEGGNLEVTVPDASIGVEGKRLALKTVRFTAVDTADGAPPAGELAFRLLGPVAAAADIADREPFRLLKSRGVTLNSPEGRLDGQFKIRLPLADTINTADLRVEGRLRLTDGRVRQALGQHDVTGAKLDLEFSDTAIDARGDFLLKGLPIKLAGQHFLNTTPDRQSPLRLTLKLDDADRAQLGLDINDIVAGEVPIEITVGPDAKGEYQTQLVADLTKAEFMLDSVAYRKPPGVAARVQFNPAKGPQGKLELRNFKIVGETIAAEGAIILGPDGKARELAFPDFSLNVVSHLDVQGRLRPEGLWEVRAKGATFDGRDLFRELFNVQSQAKTVPKDKPGLDLIADIDTVLGFSDTKLKGVHLTLQRRNEGGIEKTTHLAVSAKHESGKPFEATIRPGGERKLTATSQDAGQIFKAVGFYPNAVGGQMSLEVALDSHGAVERNGVLRAEGFAVLGDPVVSEVFQTGDTGTSGTARKKVVRERIDFDWMALPFSAGCGQFVMNDVEIRGPLVGARLRGKADFKSRRLQMGGTYIPLSGLNSALGGIPIAGQILAGPKGEGIFGITFAVVGPMSNPEVLVNPISGFVPGILRETQQLTPDSYRITPCGGGAVSARTDAARASSAAPVTAGRNPAAAAPRAQQPDVISDWSSEQRPDDRKKPAMQR